MIYTQLSLIGTPGKRYSFSAKAVAPAISAYGLRYNPFTDKLDYYLKDLTGDEIVTLLEALAGGARMSHDSLSDVSVSDHHNKYTDAEARAAAFATAAVLGTL